MAGACSICNTPDDQPHDFQHPRTSPGGSTDFLGDGKREKEKKRAPTPQPRVAYAGDLALRKLLLDKGLITASELEEANQAVQAMFGRSRAANDRG